MPLKRTAIAAVVAGLLAAACSVVESYDTETNRTCPAGQKACDVRCVGLDDPQTGCGMAGCAPCAPANATARCAPDHACAVLQCADGFGDCNGDPADGCETNLGTDPYNCLSCGRSCSVAGGIGVCTSDPSCSLTPCCKIASCETPYKDCNQDYADGCEVNTATDPANCGDCNRGCASGVCSGGSCQPAGDAATD